MLQRRRVQVGPPFRATADEPVHHVVRRGQLRPACIASVVSIFDILRSSILTVRFLTFE